MSYNCKKLKQNFINNRKYLIPKTTPKPNSNIMNTTTTPITQPCVSHRPLVTETMSTSSGASTTTTYVETPISTPVDNTDEPISVLSFIKPATEMRKVSIQNQVKTIMEKITIACQDGQCSTIISETAMNWQTRNILREHGYKIDQETRFVSSGDQSYWSSTGNMIISW